MLSSESTTKAQVAGFRSPDSLIKLNFQTFELEILRSLSELMNQPYIYGGRLSEKLNALFFSREKEMKGAERRINLIACFLESDRCINCKFDV